MLKRLLMLCFVLIAVFASSARAEVATYYHPGYAGSPTASGVPYDPGALTAAHPTLPLGSVVEVCSDVGCVPVTVNDRCACGIDLSEAAAAALGWPTSVTLR